MKKAFWFPESPQDGEEKQLPHGAHTKGTPSTIFTEDEHETSTIAISRQSSGSSASSEFTEDSFSPNMIYQTFKAEFTGDYSHLGKKPPKGYSNKDVSPYSPYSSEKELSGYNSSFPRDDGSPTINLTSPQLDDSPSDRMRRLVYTASRSRAEPPPRQYQQHDLSYSQSPSFSRATPPHARSFTKRSQSLPVVSPSNSSFGRQRKSYKSFDTYRQAQLNASQRNCNSFSSPTNRTPIKPLKRASPGAKGVVEVRPMLCQQQATTMLPSPADMSVSTEALLLQDSTACGIGAGEDVPFDEIDFFDWHSIKVQQAARTSPLLKANVEYSPSTMEFEADLLPTEELSPPPRPQQQQSLSRTDSLLELSQHRKLAKRLSQRGMDINTTSVSKSIESSFGTTTSHHSNLEKSFSVPDLSLSTTYFEPSSDGLEDSASPSPELRRVRATLARSHSWRERSSDSLPRVVLNKSKSRTSPAPKRGNVSRVTLDTKDVLAPKVLSYEQEETSRLPLEETTNKTMASMEKSELTNVKDYSFLSSSKPTLTMEEIEVALSESMTSVDLPSKRCGLNRSQSWKEPRNLSSSRRSLMNRSESFTLGSNRHVSISSAPLDSTGLRTPKMSLSKETRVKNQAPYAPKDTLPGPPMSVGTRNDVFPFSTSYKEAQAAKGGEPAPTLEPSSCLKAPNLRGFTRSWSWREKNSNLSRRPDMQRSVSFSLRSKKKDLPPPRFAEISRNFPQQSLSTPSPNAPEDIEVALGTPTSPRKRGGRRKDKPPALSKQPMQNPSADNVLDFVPAQSKPNSEGSGLGKTIGKTINRVGSRIACRSTPSRHQDTLNPFDTSPWDDAGPYGAMENESDGPKETKPTTDQGVASCSPLAAAADAPVSHDSGTIWTMDVFDDLLEKVGLGSLALTPPAPTSESQENEGSMSIMDTVASFQISNDR